MGSQAVHTEYEGGGRWEIKPSEDKDASAFMSYVNGGEGVILIDHTVVPEEFSGKGIGKKLLLTAIEYMRAHNIKTIPTCQFVKAQLLKHEEWHDVLDSSMLM